MAWTRLLFVCGCALWSTLISWGCTSQVDEPPPYLMTLRRELVGEEWIQAGGCMQVDFAPGSGTFTSSVGPVDSDDFLLEWSRVGDAPYVRVRVYSEGELLAERSFDEEFLLSGERNVLDVVTKARAVHQIVNWGGPECDVPELEDGVELQGDDA